MTSSRLPGKVMMVACGKPMLQLMIERVQHIEHIDEIVVATTMNESDEPIVDLVDTLGVKCFRGSENDVLGRVLGAAKSVEADVIVELGADCPLIDPSVATQVVEFYLANEIDYVCNDYIPVQIDCEHGSYRAYKSYPVGMDTEVFSVDSLAEADRRTKSPDDREHVSPYLITQPQFSKALVPAPPSLRSPELRLTLDCEYDYLRIRKIFETLYPNSPNFTLGDILSTIDSDPMVFEPASEHPYRSKNN